MLQAAASWLVAVLPLLDMDAEPAETTRNGNAHRRFVPTNVYPTRDGFIYMALGSNAQWQRFTALPRYKALARPDWATAEGRYAGRQEIYRALGAATATGTSAEVAAEFAAAKIPHTRINTLAEAAALEAVARRLNRTELPGGRKVRLPPAAVDLPETPRRFAAPPRYAEHTRAILAEAKIGAGEIDRLFATGVVASPNPSC